MRTTTQIVKQQTIASKFISVYYNRLNIDGYSVPENEKLSINETKNYVDSISTSYYWKQKFEELEYQPPIIRKKFQISLWRIDEYGVVKTRSRYDILFNV